MIRLWCIIVFFRTVITDPLNYFWSNKQINIENIFHDKADDKEMHEYFPRHLFYKLIENIPKVTCETDSINFLDSDHKKNNDSNLVCEAQLIQFIDLILGATNQILFNSSEDPKRIEIDNIIFDLIDRLMNSHDNKNSSFHYYKKQQIAFFPKEKITLTKDLFNNEQIIRGQFHRNIKIRKPIKINKNESLEKWL